MNLLTTITDSSSTASPSLFWDHKPVTVETLPGGGLRVHVPPQVDYFQDPAGVMQNDSAPYLWKEVSGDFVAQAHVKPGFNTHYDAGAIMVRHDSHHWAKLCFESTDIGTTAAVSVVTNGVSDDANGANLDTEDLWLQVSRIGDVFTMHYSLDGKTWRMVRIFRLSLPAAVRVGLVAQCPVGPGTTIDFLYFNIEQRTIQNPRAGV